MLPIERRQKILLSMGNSEMVTITSLVETFNVSIETIRRDLNILEKQEKIEKVYGGAILKVLDYKEATMHHRMIDRQESKNAIGKRCSDFINHGDFIYLDSGSTTFHIAKHIKHKKNLTIITNSIPIVNELEETDFDIILIGGRVRRSEHSIVTYNYMFNFSQINIQKCFICAGGLTIDNGVSDYNMQEVETRKEILKRSKEIFVAADSSKFGVDCLINVAPLDTIDHIVTNNDLDCRYIDYFNELHTTLILVP